MRVVLVEDDFDIARLWVLALTRAGHSVVRVAPSADGLADDPAWWTDVDAAIVDLMLPGETSGTELATWLAQQRPDIGLVVATAAPELAARLPAGVPVWIKGAGADTDALVGMLEEATDGSR